MKNRCANYDKEFECCRILSDWSEAMPALQSCIESPCKYFKPYINYDRIKSMSVEEMAKFIINITDMVMSHKFCQAIKVADYPYSCEDTRECCIKHFKQWLEQEVEK